ncbi:MAG: hypothetical protein IPG04_05635 [Polyangiaceae bacterium]|nr:hypothetical protein [Polyangiaceae bacterium]
MPALDVEALARTLAHVAHFPPEQRAEVLSRLGCTKAELDEALATHPSAIAKAAARGDHAGARRFDDAFLSEKTRLAAEAPQVDGVQPLPGRSLAPAPAAPAAASIGDDITLDPRSGAALAAAVPFKPGVAVQAPAAIAILRAPETALAGPGGTLDVAPPRGPAEEQLAAWTVERYARFTAERRYGDPEAVRAEYGVVDASHEHALIIHMNRRLAATPRAHERWAALVAARLAELADKGGR